ncbi:MAG: enoyl-CoA hydratase-related protein [Thermoplasmatota archaeon]
MGLARATVELAVRGEVAWLALNRPDVHNAFNEELLRELTGAVSEVAGDSGIRALVLTGRGRSFCAGADLNWMRAALGYTVEQNRRDASALVDLLELLDGLPKPVVGRINGSAVGGGVGLVAVCDIAIASSEARFGFGEVKLGLVPAMIAPYVIRKTGEGPVRELFLTGERIDAERARSIGLVGDVVAPDRLDEAVGARLEALLTSAPGAIAEAKSLIRTVRRLEGEELRHYTISRIAELRASEEGQEGMRAFLEKRRPKWVR